MNPPSVSPILPSFYEKAASISMVKHGSDIIKMVTQYLNPGQLLVLTFDEPLFALAKFQLTLITKPRLKHGRRRWQTFQYWDIILEVELLIHTLVHAHRTGNFDSYVEILEEIAPWFFALDRINYARWIPVHIRDMKLMTNELKVEFSKYWVVQKTVNRFSLIPIDQYHEQNNAILKGEGGMKGLTENANTCRNWAQLQHQNNVA